LVSVICARCPSIKKYDFFGDNNLKATEPQNTETEDKNYRNCKHRTQYCDGRHVATTCIGCSIVTTGIIVLKHFSLSAWMG